MCILDISSKNHQSKKSCVKAKINSSINVFLGLYQEENVHYNFSLDNFPTFLLKYAQVSLAGTSPTLNLGTCRRDVRTYLDPTKTSDPNIRTETMFHWGRTTNARARTVQNFLANSARGRTTPFHYAYRKFFKWRRRGGKRTELQNQ